MLADFEKDIFEVHQLTRYVNEADKLQDMTPLNLVDILKQVIANADFYRIYLNNMHAGYLTDAIQNLSHDVIDYWMKQNLFHERADAEYFFLFYKSGIIAVVKEWLEEPEDTRKTPKELADTLSMIMSINLELVSS